MEKFWGENVRSTSTSITPGRIESTESHVILGEGVGCGCLFMFPFVGASRGHICDSTAFLYCDVISCTLARPKPAAAVDSSACWRGNAVTRRSDLDPRSRTFFLVLLTRRVAVSLNAISATSTTFFHVEPG